MYIFIYRETVDVRVGIVGTAAQATLKTLCLQAFTLIRP